VRRLTGAIDDALFGPETGARLVYVQSGLAVVLALRMALGPYRAFAELPTALFDPVPVLAWLPGVPSAAVIIAVQVAGASAALAAAFRRWPRQTFAVAWLCYLFLAGLRGSRGKVLHNDLLLLWTSAVFLLAPTRVSVRDREPSRTYGWPVRVAIVVTALIYFLAAFHKLQRSGLDWVLGDNMRYVLRWGPSVGEPALPGLAAWVGRNAIPAHLSAAFILGVELAFPLAIFWRRARPVLALAAVVLHLGTWLLLGLDYWAWALAVPIVLIDWVWVVDRLRGHDPRSGKRTAVA
jgi:hypothetical protein